MNRPWGEVDSALCEALLAGGRVYADGDEVIVVDPDTGFEEVVYHRGSGAAASEVDVVSDWWMEVETAVQELMETRSRLARLEAQIQRARDRGSDDPAMLIDRLIADLGLARRSARRLRLLIGDGDES